MDPTAWKQRCDWRANQQIAYSKVAEDGAVFGSLNFLFDQRYFPFEGTGAVSSWRLEIPQVTNDISLDDIDDVVIILKYTASPGGENFKKDVMAEVK